MPPGPRQAIDPPPAQQPVHGLIATAVALGQDVYGDPNGRWTNGVTYEPECVPVGTTTDLCDPATKPNPAPTAEVSFDTFALTSAYRCSTIGYFGQDYFARARRYLQADQERQLSAELWTGTVAQAESYPNRFLADVANVDILSEGGPIGLTAALACLEQGLNDCNAGQRGMIHATTQTVTHWFGLNLLRREGPLILTVKDTVVVPGVGYDGSDPNGNSPSDIGAVWAYATGIVTVKLGGIKTLGGPDDLSFVDRATNTARVIAERVGLVAFDGCCHLGVGIEITPCDVGGS